MNALWVAVCLASVGASASEGATSDGGLGPSPAETAPGSTNDVPVAAPRLEPSAVDHVGVATSGESSAPTLGFIKGELSVYLGSDRLVVKNTRVGVSLGLDRFESAYYALVEPMVDLRFLDAKLGIGVGVPLRFEIVNFSSDSSGQPILTKRLGRLRVEDWDTLHDFGRVLKYVTYGRKEDNLYISAGQRYASSLGHGALVRRYSPSIDIDYPRASAQVDWYNQYAGFEFFTNDLLEWNTLAALAFIKPLAFINKENLFTQSLSLGVSAALDWAAPWQLTTNAQTGLRQLDANGRLLASTRAVKLIGFDAEIKVVKTEHVDLKPYVDYSLLIDGDGGFTVGLLGRFNVGTKTVHAFRTVTELRILGSRYIPSYFDTFYEIERYVATELPRVNPDVANYATKQQATLAGYGQRVGYYVEGSWGIPGKVGFTLAAEGVSNAPDTNLVAHLEVPVLDFLQVFGSYYKRGLKEAKGLVSFDTNTILFAGARLKVLPFLFINGRLYKTFRMNPELQRYDNQLGFVVDLEIGYEFKKREPPPPPPTESEGSAVSLPGQPT